MPKRSEVVEIARTYIGTPFRHQGRWKGRGIDCLGLVIKVAHDIHLTDYDHVKYPHQPNGELLRAKLMEYLNEKPIALMQPGDVLLLRTPIPVHVAIVGEIPGQGLSLIHAYAPNRKVVEHIIDAEWRSRIETCFAYPGVE